MKYVRKLSMKMAHLRIIALGCLNWRCSQVLSTPIRTLAFIPSLFLFLKQMEGLQRSRYGTMAEGKKPSKFSKSSWTPGDSYCLPSPPLTSNTETEKPVTLNCRRKGSYHVLCLPYCHHTLHTQVWHSDPCGDVWKRGNKTSSQKSVDLEPIV